ncbi:MAG: tripartite tricarboxylate transporter substrate binding protein [Actinomycetota bacterium]|nr:tripartite tricarboxylate transporter substrate binding protein [Actinomycetota bacterium]
MILTSRSGRTSYRYLTGATVVTLALAGCGGGAGDGGSSTNSGAGSGAESFYEGKTIDLVVPYEPGGGYDTYARALAPHLEECLGATVVVQNEPGAGGLLATNKTFSASPDELRLQVVNSVGAVSAQMAGDDGAQFDMTEFSALGRIVATVSAVAVSPDSDVQDFQQFIDEGGTVRFPSTGPGANDYITPNVLAAIYGFSTEMITGYQGSGEARLALIQGDGDAYVQSWDSMLDAIESGEVKAILVASEESVEQLPDVPTLADYEPATDNGDQLREDLAALEATGRGVVAPPELPEDRLTELRDAYNCAFEKQELLDELEKQGRPLGLQSGEEWQKTLETALNTSEEFQTVIADSF